VLLNPDAARRFNSACSNGERTAVQTCRAYVYDQRYLLGRPIWDALSGRSYLGRFIWDVLSATPHLRRLIWDASSGTPSSSY